MELKVELDKQFKSDALKRIELGMLQEGKKQKIFNFLFMIILLLVITIALKDLV